MKHHPNIMKYHVNLMKYHYSLPRDRRVELGTQGVTTFLNDIFLGAGCRTVNMSGCQQKVDTLCVPNSTRRSRVTQSCGGIT